MAVPRPFAARLLRWYGRHGRRDLPWQHPRTPYRVWVAEIMLQQTQVAAVVPYFRRFMRRFPSLRALARADLDDVLAAWSGLGYYARARNLHAAARHIARNHGGRIPSDLESLVALPGIGRSTAGAILAQAFGQRHAILDGNARRVFARHAAVRGWPGEARIQERLWSLAEAQLPRRRLADYTQALMDLGATRCTARKPRCADCPVSGDCVAHRRGLIAVIPAPRPRPPRPHRGTTVVLLRRGTADILLERRPASGIWGGLWCPPMTTGRWQSALPRRWRATGRARRHEAIAHAFTHFELTLQPVEVRIASARARAPTDMAWVRLDRLDDRGLPTPIRRLLQELD